MSLGSPPVHASHGKGYHLGANFNVWHWYSLETGFQSAGWWLQDHCRSIFVILSSQASPDPLLCTQLCGLAGRAS